MDRHLQEKWTDHPGKLHLQVGIQSPDDMRTGPGRLGDCHLSQIEKLALLIDQQLIIAPLESISKLQI